VTALKILPFKKILIANRGEIAIRVLRAAAELGIKTVAIYTYEDRYSLHRYQADESYQIGEKDDPLKPYLDIEEIIKIAQNNQVDAIHPGYGFLSENVDFARRCGEVGIKFVGPSPESMAMLGDKMASKAVAATVGIPLIEGSKLPLTDAAIATSEAIRIGFPVIIKASGGGGGRGMRVVRDASSIGQEFETARNEAGKAFGNDTVFLEKFIEKPKHLEVQILGDEHGNLVHLYERDCSVQRRFQKVVEIAPNSTLSAKTKEKLYEYALALATAARYSCAGTVEFLVDASENIYFIEVNPRIQVEHTITEEITGIDIVRSQILVAMGYHLHHKRIGIPNQDSIQISGFAIQCRLTTEDPRNDFKPDFGSISAFRVATGMGIRLDAGSAYQGAVISPFFDSLLVKITAWGRTMEDASARLQRAISEFRVRGVVTNADFLVNLLKNETFVRGEATVDFIKENPSLFQLRRQQNRGNKILHFLADVIVNGNSDVPERDEKIEILFRDPQVPEFDHKAQPPTGSRQLLDKLGAEGLAKWVKNEKGILYTDTTFRDAHQSLLATRVRTYDMVQVAASFAHHHHADVFSMEVWGGATFDVCMRFQKEDPWQRLELLRKAIPNVLFQMLLRGSNGLGYAAYPDNLLEACIDEAAETGMDIFRIFDSLNYVPNMRTSIQRVRKTGKVAQACICYTGDMSNVAERKFTLQYYLNLAKRLEDEGAHMLCIKDMAGLLKPEAAKELIPALKDCLQIPVHLHTHDTSSIQSVTYLRAIETGVDSIDVALASMSGLTSQPNFNAIVAMMQGHERERKADLKSLNQFSNYWEAVRLYYYPFESELKAGTAEVFDHEIPGGQYSNLRPQARGLGLEDKFEKIKENYISANQLFGNIVKVTPSSKVVGDLALFMTANGLNKQDVLEKGSTLSFPDSVKAMMRGDLGQVEGGWPKAFQKMVLKDEEPYTDSPNAHLDPIDFDAEWLVFKAKFGDHYKHRDMLSWMLYSKVFSDFHDSLTQNGEVSILPTPAFLYGLKPNEEMMVTLEPGKTLLIRYLNMVSPNAEGKRQVFFRLNGQTRSVEVADNSIKVETVRHVKASGEKQIGAPLQGNLSQILVKVGDLVQVNTPLFIIEAMKMESTVTAPIAGKIKALHLSDRTLVAQDDLVVELE
jgi:pyruvate carboxylase